MAKGVQTRLQKEVSTLQKEVQRIDASNEQNRSEIHASVEAMGTEMRQMFEKLMLKINSNITATNLIEPSGSTKSRPIIVSEEKSFTKHTKLQCPHFNDDDFLGWKLKVEQFFAADNTKDKHKVLIAMMHLDGRALQWHQRFMRDKGSLHERIRLFYPKTLNHAFNLAKQVEVMIFNLPRKPNLPYKQYTSSALSNPTLISTIPTPLPALLPAPQNTKPTITFPQHNRTPNTTTTTSKNPPLLHRTQNARAPTREERDEHRKKGLCMWCGIKYSPGHSCVRSNLLSILQADPEDTVPELDNCTEVTQAEISAIKATLDPILFLHAILGTSDHQTMRIIGTIKHQEVIILIDSGSSHNFMDKTTAKRICWKTHQVTGVGVKVANGYQLWAKDICYEVPWELKV
ncbi:hypothetical protein COLO4_36099 [Corchorus olitorius]|uniref:Retrotransposon gag protein n=1 Tax=Corchorus olitorius TaxID=93759 RepID=A0A1R3GAX9_9ROSI|nr:hypothetical protein COLO4_36099 [Corchorus olitorius]